MVGMRPYEHYQEAERLLEKIDEITKDMPLYTNHRDIREVFANLTLLAIEAQVHATLANVGTKTSAGDGSI